VRDAALTDDDKTNYALDVASHPADFRAYDKGPVKDLQNALVWVDHHGEGEEVLGNGEPVGYANGTTEGYSEYRLFLKQDQAIGKIVLSFLNQRGTYNGNAITELDTRDRMSIQLYGAGSPGTAEKTISRNLDAFQDETKDTLNYGNAQIVGYGLISFSRAQGGGSQPNPQNGLKYKALVLGKNITIDGGGQANPLTSSTTVRNAFCIDDNSTVIMEKHSKVTDFYISSTSDLCTPILLTKNTSRFYMRSGSSITGNSHGKKKGTLTGVIVLNLTGVTIPAGDNGSTWVTVETGAYIGGNTAINPANLTDINSINSIMSSKNSGVLRQF
jgi:hypothetical protein